MRTCSFQGKINFVTPKKTVSILQSYGLRGLWLGSHFLSWAVNTRYNKIALFEVFHGSTQVQCGETGNHSGFFTETPHMTAAVSFPLHVPFKHLRNISATARAAFVHIHTSARVSSQWHSNFPALELLTSLELIHVSNLVAPMPPALARLWAVVPFTPGASVSRRDLKSLLPLITQTAKTFHVDTLQGHLMLMTNQFDCLA